MRNLLRLVVLCILLTSFSLLPANRVFACSCVPPGSPAEAMANASAVFSGQVVNVAAPMGIVISSGDPVRVTFQVSTVWKGLSQKTATVTTARNGASCGYEFQLSQTYLVYASAGEDGLSTHLCTRTKLLSEAAEDLAQLGPGTTVSQDTTDSAGSLLKNLPIVLLGAGVVIALAVVLFGVLGLRISRSA